MKTRSLAIWTTLIVLAGSAWALAEAPATTEVGIEEHLGSYLPMDTVFVNEAGKPVPLRTIVTKPTLLTLVYFECPGICSPLLNGLVATLDQTDLEPGKDYQVLTISFDARDGYELAAKKKENYLRSLTRPFPRDNWHFMTGDQQAIDAITEAVGFRYQRVGEDFKHAGVITVLMPDGKIARYLHGVTFLPFDIKMSVIEASKGKTMPALNRVLAFCYSYDPQGRQYVFNLLKVAGIAVSAFAAIFVAWLVITTKRYRKGLMQSP